MFFWPHLTFFIRTYLCRIIKALKSEIPGILLSTWLPTFVKWAPFFFLLRRFYHFWRHQIIDDQIILSNSGLVRAEIFTIFLWQLFILCWVVFSSKLNSKESTKFVVFGVQLKSETLKLNDLMQILNINCSKSFMICLKL